MTAPKSGSDLVVIKVATAAAVLENRQGLAKGQTVVGNLGIDSSNERSRKEFLWCVRHESNFDAPKNLHL